MFGIVCIYFKITGMHDLHGFFLGLQFSLRVPDRKLNYRTQFLHSHQRKRKPEISTHLKINHNEKIPLVAGLHWKDVSAKGSLQKWEGTKRIKPSDV